MPFKYNAIHGILDLVNVASTSTGSGTGDFNGPAASTNNNFVIFSGTGGKTGKDLGIGIDAYQSVTATNIDYATATHTTISATTITATNIGSVNLSVTNFETSTLSAASVTATSLASLNISTTNLSASLVTATSLTGNNVLSPTATHTTISATTVTATTINSATVSSPNLAGLNIITATATHTTISVTTVTATTISGATITSPNFGGVNIVTATATFTTLGATTVTSTNFGGVTATLATITATNVRGNTATFTDITSTNLNGVAISNTMLQGFSFILDGGTGTISNGTVKGFCVIPYSATITNLYLMGDQDGNIELDIWKAPYSATNLPTNGNSIFGAVVFSLSNAQAMSLSSGFTGSILANDILRFNVDSCSTLTNCTIGISMKKI